MDVTVIHRRDELRAEKTLEEEAKEKGIQFMWNSIVEEILGDETVTGMKIKNVKTNETKIYNFDGIFISIGEEPQNALAKKIDVQLDKEGYIVTNDLQQTNIQRIFAAGDITGGIRQIVTACAQGTIAALSALPIVGKRSPY
jgi:thioredoxin reductase (NADPH)